MMKLMLLEPHARALISEEFMRGDVDLDLGKHIRPFGRDVDLEPLISVVKQTMTKFGGMSPSKSDGWLAPRVHCALRLTRRDAADSRVWDYLAVVAIPEYIRWRWESDDRLKRFVGSAEYIQSIARLWWGAELTRNGQSYASTPLLYANQDLQNSWARCDLFHHRPTAIASLRFLDRMNEGGFATSDQIRDLIKSFNMALTTTLLDSVAPDPGPDAVAVWEWCTEQFDETKWNESEPIGPAEPEVDDASISAVTELLKRVVSKTRFGRRIRNTKAEPAQTAILDVNQIEEAPAA